MVALLPLCVNTFMPAVAAKNPGNAKHSDLNHNMERGGLNENSSRSQKGGAEKHMKHAASKHMINYWSAFK